VGGFVDDSPRTNLRLGDLAVYKDRTTERFITRTMLCGKMAFVVLCLAIIQASSTIDLAGTSDANDPSRVILNHMQDNEATVIDHAAGEDISEEANIEVRALLLDGMEVYFNWPSSAFCFFCV
jgi:hypothetical protein